MEWIKQKSELLYKSSDFFVVVDAAGLEPTTSCV